ncbi:NAD-dependent epimerase/dehydratase family protein [Aureivirga sp. CE67]|uniref:NAD-dependent epimerase/dehydratase family protein n=1 Tax=Aureivirga sp. CE67 TaxID=1788983 RepID=UPI0018CA0BBD|nr:NAD-dependent epimerase/dehydratase family protein [Aureivirga sp. CE67]
MRKIFVTGINGLLGTNLVHELLDKGYLVKGFLRNKNKYQGKLHPNLELIEGTLFDDFTEVLKDVDAVIHIAAVTDMNLSSYSQYWEVNTNATIQLFHAAIKSKVKKFVFVSTANTLGFGTKGIDGTEKQKMKFPFTNSFYAKSKKEAENRLLENKDKIETIIVNPTFMLGRYDTKPSSGQIILMGWKKKILFYPSGGKNFVHVKDVANGIIQSLKSGVSGEKYLLANENLTYKQFFQKLNKTTKQNPIMIRVPKGILLGVGYFGNVLRFFKLKTGINSTNMKSLCIENFYSNQKSKEALNLEYQPIENAIQDAVEFFEKTKS